MQTLKCVNITQHYDNNRLSAITVNNKRMEVETVRLAPNTRQSDGSGVPLVPQMFAEEEEPQQQQNTECRKKYDTQVIKTNVKGLECYSAPEMEW